MDKRILNRFPIIVHFIDDIYANNSYFKQSDYKILFVAEFMPLFTFLNIL